MSIFDIFKTQWSAGKMTQDDRKKIFWYLKRKTSYTAWKLKSDAFDRFAEIFEKQVKEQPHAPGLMEGTNWDTSYPEILKGQVFFEKGLERLKQGDRTVWLYNDRGILDDASTISGDWYSELVNNGMRGDHFFDGKYVDDMTESMRQFSLASREAGYLQPMMAETPAPETWDEFLECKLNNEEWPRVIEPFTPQEKKRYAATIPAADELPSVPVPEKEVLIRTGETVPVFGIYEPQVKDGCMNYLLGGIPAPTLRTDSGDNLSVIWRLLWEDTRYQDGEIPSEESQYFSLENKSAEQTTSATNNLISIPTGKICPKTGTWAVMDNLNGSLIIKQGETMPQYDGRDVIWVLVV